MPTHNPSGPAREQKADERGNREQKGQKSGTWSRGTGGWSLNAWHVPPVSKVSLECVTVCLVGQLDCAHWHDTVGPYWTSEAEWLSCHLKQEGV
ncbi:hypothetical protein Y1Q_0023810 [Alligator mississippiensis]|uniref:Uncharacterized protein n=1 Tax=Alligator mississippiensis TaxID=8496 RepID=A0A151MKA7_ALLMI|nr:hypothetical protein Y1Q_0023810 [Alligator mississippiensis]